MGGMRGRGAERGGEGRKHLIYQFLRTPLAALSDFCLFWCVAYKFSYLVTYLFFTYSWFTKYRDEQMKRCAYVEAMMLGSCGVFGVTLTATTSKVIRGAATLMRYDPDFMLSRWYVPCCCVVATCRPSIMIRAPITPEPYSSHINSHNIKL